MDALRAGMKFGFVVGKQGLDVVVPPGEKSKANRGKTVLMVARSRGEDGLRCELYYDRDEGYGVECAVERVDGRARATHF